MNSKLLAFIFTSLLFQSCNLSTSGIWKNDHIKKLTRDEIKIQNDKLYEALKTSDAAGIKNLVSEAILQKNGSDLDSLLIKTGDMFAHSTYSVVDEFDVRNSSTNVSDVIPGEQGEESYTINYIAVNKETYVSLLDIKTGIQDFLITAIYGNYNGAWKINILEVGQFKYFDRTPLHYYRLAKSHYQKKFLIDAVDDISVAKACLRPGAAIFHYKNEAEIENFYDTVIHYTNKLYQFPIKLETVPTSPKIFTVYPQLLREGYFPTIRYLSTIELSDTTKLKKENDLIQKAVKDIMPGIGIGKKYILYQAFNEAQNGQYFNRHYSFVEILQGQK